MKSLVKVCSLFAIAGLFSTTIGQNVFNETFAGYSDGNLEDNSGGNWQNYFAGTQIQIASGSLRYMGYEYDNVGKHVELSGENGHSVRIFPSTVITGTLYAAFLANFNSGGATDGYFLHFVQDLQGATDVPRAELHVKDTLTSKVHFAVRKTLDQSDFTTATWNQGDTLLIVVGYQIGTDDGATDDVIKLWVNPTPGQSTEPAATLTFTSPTDADVRDDGFSGGTYGTSAPFDAIVLAQKLGAGGSVWIGGMRVSTTWADATLPVQLIEFNALASRSGVTLQWSTASELNNYGFEIERREVKGSEFQVAGSAWNRIGFIQGAGTTTSRQDYSYVDSDVLPGRYAYRIKQIDFNGASTYYTSTEVEVGLAPKELALEPNYPNPFNPATNIAFTVPEDGRVALKVYNMLGQEVAVLFDGMAVAGKLYQATFDASSLPTGVYVSRLEYGSQSVMRKMVFVR